MLTNRSTSASSFLLGAYVLCAFIFLLLLTYNHVKIISHELPLDYQETGMLAITSTITDGGNPFSLESQPVNISLYPAAYNILMAPVTKALGNTLPVHRLVAGLFIIASCALCFVLCRKASGTRADSFVAALMLYCVFLYYSTPIASPSGPGLFLFLACITIPWICNFSPRSLALSIALGILAFFTKQYFVAALGYVALYLFLAISKKQAIYYGLVFAAALLLTLALVVYTSPYYLDNTFFAQQSAARLIASNEKVFIQFKEYLLVYYPLIAILVFAAAYPLFESRQMQGQREYDSEHSKPVDIADIEKPLLTRPPEYLWVCTACSVLIIALVLGKNPGNHLTYLFQLISPFLLAGFLGLVFTVKKWAWLLRGAAILALYNSYSLLPTDFAVKERNWKIISEEVSTADEIYASTLFLQQIMEEEKKIYHNGHTSYFALGQFKPSAFVRANPEETVHEIWERHVARIESKIENREFDLILLDTWLKLPRSIRNTEADTNRVLDANYDLVAELPVHLMKRPGGGAFRIRMYKPKEPR